MSLTLAAVGAVAAALFDTSVAPFLRIGGAQLNLVLVMAVVWTIVVDVEGGLTWAFVGGLLIDLLAPRPLGSTAFALLLTVGAIAVAARFASRGRYLRPVVGVFVASLLYGSIVLVVTRALRGPMPLSDGLGAIVPSALLDALVAAIVGSIVVRIHARRVDRDRVDW